MFRSTNEIFFCVCVSWNLQDKTPKKRLLSVKVGGLVGKALASGVGGCGLKSGVASDWRREKGGEKKKKKRGGGGSVS